MKETDFRIIEEGLISVCMDCHPGETILQAHPELRGKFDISHGLCRSCFEIRHPGALPK